VLQTSEGHLLTHNYAMSYLNRHDSLMVLIQSPTSMIAENATVILQVLINHSRKVEHLIRESALTSGALLKHFYHAIFSPNEGQRVLSRYLSGMWMAAADSAERQLLGRMIPSGFHTYLIMPTLSLEEEDQLDFLERSEEDEGQYECSGGAGINIVRFRQRIKMVESLSNTTSNVLRKQANFRIFFHVLTQNHSLPDLIWNQHTRMDLKNALTLEIKSIEEETEARGNVQEIAWNHEQFSVLYPSLEKEVQVGSVYMRLWLQASDSFIKTWDDPVRLFELLFRRFLCEIDRNVLVRIIGMFFLSCFLTNHSHFFWICISGCKHVHKVPRTFVLHSCCKNWAFS
jgi:hypothetical protein